MDLQTYQYYSNRTYNITLLAPPPPPFEFKQTAVVVRLKT